MTNVAQVWDEALPEIMKGVTGVGVWTALKAAKPIVFEEGVFVLGLDSHESELAGHLRLPHSRQTVETVTARHLNSRVTLRIINGTTLHDWQTEKKRDEEKRKLQEQAVARQRAEIAAGKSWDTVYEQLSREYAALPNRSLPQNRARFFMQAVQIVADALLETPITDDLAERQYARCLERISQYCEIPSVFVALKVLEKSFEG
ncbi:MAG: hypothetical protein MUC92_00335 [Fimbriimonadaceae bacterium]|jgi:hypothetical protein|nr:hypothetical protein [Fimbriimonadaceae bacterium]